MEDNWVGYKELLVARINKRYRKICEWIQYMSENKESDRNTSREVDNEWSARETMDIFDSRLYHKVAISR